MPTKVVRTSKTTLGPRGRPLTTDDAVIDSGEKAAIEDPAMVVQIHPASATIFPRSTAGALDPTFSSQRVTQKPAEYGAFGHYKLATTWSQTANPGTGPVLSIRFAPPSGVMVLTKIVWTHCVLTSIFDVQQYVDLGAQIIRSWTASDTGGTSLLSALGASNMMRTSMASSAISDIRNGAGSNISLGTSTNDSYAFCQACADVNSNTLTTGGTPLLTSGPKVLYQPLPGQDSPVILAPNEGIRIYSPHGIHGTGVLTLGVQIEWLEAASY